MMAGIPQYTTYLVHRLYNREMSMAEMQKLTAYLISETATQNPKVGGPIRMASITPDKGYIEVSPSHIESIMQELTTLNEVLRSIFFEKKEKKRGG